MRDGIDYHLNVSGIVIWNNGPAPGARIYSAAFRSPHGQEPKEYFLFTQQVSGVMIRARGRRILPVSDLLWTWKSALRVGAAACASRWEEDATSSIGHALANAATCKSRSRSVVDVCDGGHTILFPLNTLVSNALTHLGAEFVTKGKVSAKGVKRLQAPYRFKTVPKFFASTLHALC